MNELLDINKTYKHGPACMLDELSTITLLYVGNNLIVYKYNHNDVEMSMPIDSWMEWAHIVE